MKLAYKDVTTGKRLDVVTIVGEKITYKTGAAKSVVEGKINTFGQAGAIEVLKSWSNGYVATSEMTG